MATSGTSVFSTTRNKIINHAGRLCGVLRDGESMGAGKRGEFEYALNAMVKHWQGKGMRVWTVSEGVLVPAVGQSVYGVGPAATDHVALEDDFFITQLAADVAAGGSAIMVDDSSEIMDGDNIGIVVDDGTVQWTTVASQGGGMITLAAPLDTAAQNDTFVFTYTTKLMRPVEVPQDFARTYNLVQQTVMPIEVVARKDFRWLSNPNGRGNITQMMYDKQGNSGKLSIWQTPQAITDILKFTFHRPIEDFNAADDTPDLPQEWILTMGFNLALIKAPEHGVNPQRYAYIKEQALQYLDDMTGFDREDESVFFGPDMEGR